MAFSGRYLGIGFVVWLLGTMLLRLGGQFIFAPGNTLALVGAFLAMAAFALVIRATLARLSDVQRRAAIIALVLPGMLLDALSILGFAVVFPNLDTTMRGPIAAWLLWGYWLLLLVSLLPARPMRLVTQ